MSKVAIVGDPSGTGTFTISAPNGNTDRTLVLPDEAGTVLTTAGVPASAMPAGSVIQVVGGTYSTYTAISSTSYTDFGPSLSITPTKTSSKVLVLFTLSGRVYTTANNDRVYFLNMVRNTTEITNKNTRLQCGVGANNYAVNPIMDSICYLDSPSTTSAVTYKLQCKVDNTSGNTYLEINGDGGVCTIVLMEIAA